MKIEIQCDSILLPKTSEMITKMGFIPEKGSFVWVHKEDYNIELRDGTIASDNSFIVDMFMINTNSKTVIIDCDT